MLHFLYSIDAALLEEYNKMTSKAKQVILDSVKDRSIPHIVRKKTDKEMSNAEVSLYQSENTNWKMLPVFIYNDFLYKIYNSENHNCKCGILLSNLDFKFILNNKIWNSKLFNLPIYKYLWSYN